MCTPLPSRPYAGVALCCIYRRGIGLFIPSLIYLYIAYTYRLTVGKAS